MQITRLVLGDIQSNCYLLGIGDGKCIAVDIGEAEPLSAYLSEHKQTLCAILLTHGHYDHIAGVEAIRKAWDVPVYIHTLDAPMLTDSTANLGDFLSPEPFLPVQKWVTVEDGEELQFGNISLKVIHTPGHTTGSVCWQCGEMLLTGDTLFHLSRGRTDFPGGSDADMLESLRKLAHLSKDYRVYPGHNEETTLFYEKEHNPSMRGL